jgi:D-alanyl-D-alanine carboxypeptidase
MNKVCNRVRTAFCMAAAIGVLAGCSQPSFSTVRQVAPAATAPSKTAPGNTAAPTAPHPAGTAAPTDPAPTNPAAPPQGQNGSKPAFNDNEPRQDGQVVANPDDILVLVNKRFGLPADYRPADLVEPKVPFIFEGWDEKRLMRKEAADALERMFAAAQKDGIHLAGVSGYRSYQTQKALFEYYVRTQGEEYARKYSAEPGHSEHQTGLAMDVSGSTGQCAADDCFAGTPEAEWLAKHAPDFGFIIRYPKGKESVTGYNYEPWHLRYVGTAVSKEIAAKGLTLEEYLGQAQ